MKAISSFLKSLLDPKVEMRVRLLNILIIGATIGDIISTIPMVIGNQVGIGIITNIVLFIGCILSFWLSAVKGKTKIATVILILVADLVILPMMYFTEGGTRGGMPIWLVFDIIVSFMMLEGVFRFIFCGIVVVVDAACVLIGYYNPDMVTGYEDPTAAVNDVASSIVIAGIIVCLMIWLHLLSYKKQEMVLQQQQVQLLEKQKELEGALDRATNADKAKSIFLANMSHEIRTPLNAVLGMAEMISRDSGEEHTLQYSNNILSSGQALLSIINDILDFSKIEAGSMELIPNDYRLSKLLNDIYNMLYPRAKEKNLSFSIENNPDICDELYGDEARIRQIILNLTTNAIKYTNSGSVKLYIDYQKESEGYITLKVSVTDTGIGIKEENMDKLFTSFERVDLVKNRNIEGTGLGLAITKKFVEMMGGTVDVISEYGRGSTFAFGIRQKVRSDKKLGVFKVTSDGSKSTYQQSFTAPTARVLVVDDIDMNLVVFGCLLQKTCIQIDTALSGEECIKLSENHKYDVIFLDHMMPGIDGTETLKLMRDNEVDKNRNTPVIMLTANAVTGAKEEYLAMGFDDYLTKPVVDNELEEMLVKYLPKDKLEIEQ